MVSAQSKPYLSAREYFRIEAAAETKSQYFDGAMYSMAGGTFRHGLISTNLLRELGNQLKRSSKECRTVNSDVRIGVPETGLRTYPDASVICGTVDFDADDEEKTTATNPALIAEVLSPSTESYDRGKKFQHYQTIPSLREYLIVSQDEPKIETFLRQTDGGWHYQLITGLEGSVRLESFGVEISLAEIYDGVEFDEPPLLTLVK